ncbi:MAG TPA: hypothetical protein VKZ77_00720 [Bacillaceae bacterium]|nr:hypothetical protein [Paenibacillus bovis]HLU20986.1 hypothetical protein [Bacillaceae bacterium]
MMKVIFNLFCIVTFLFLIPQNAYYAVSLEDAEKVENQELKLEKEILNEFNTSFNLRFDGYEKLSIINLGLLLKRDSSLYDLYEVSANLYKQGTIGEPIIFLKPTKAYILIKNKDGKKILLTFKKENQRWMILNAQEK